MAPVSTCGQALPDELVCLNFGCSHDLDALDPMTNLPHSGMLELCLAQQPYLVSTGYSTD